MERIYFSDQFPIEVVSAQIVDELAKRNWLLPGIYAEHRGSVPRRITGKNFRIVFGISTRDSKILCVTLVNIPMVEVHLYEEKTGPSLYVYAGNNWPNDEERFTDDFKIISKIRLGKRLYLAYRGSDSPEKRTHTPNQNPKYLIHDNDSGREYEPAEGDKSYFLAEEVYTEIADWLRRNVLDYIRNFEIVKS